MTRSIDRQPDRVVYEAFNGDKLTTFQREPSVAYRLLRVSDSAHAEVLMYGGQADAVAQARLVYDVDRPDFIQVRTVRGALLERQSKLTVDLGRKYQDEFRNFRDRAARVEDLPERGKAYTFDAAAVDIPFVRVEDAVGDETEPGKFPRVFRTAFYRDGTVRRYVVTEAGDALGTLARPDSAAWSAVLPQHREWLPGQAETLPPFTPAISGSGALLPGRILVLAYRPRLVQPSPRPTASTSDAAAGLECLGVPLAALFAALGWVARVRPGA